MRIFVFVFLIILIGCGIPPQTVTINAIDPATGIIISPVNLWNDYQDRSKGIAGTVRHNESVSLIREQGGAALIRTSQGVEGWLNIQFIQR